MKVAVLADLLRPNGAGLMALSQARILSREHNVVLLSGASARTRGSSSFQHLSFATSENILDQPLTVAEGRHLRREFGAWLTTSLNDFGAEVLITHNIGRVLDQNQVADLSRTVPVAATIHDQWWIRDAHYSFRHNGSVRHEFEPSRATGNAHNFSHLATVGQRAGRLVGISPSRWLSDEWAAVYPTLPCLHLHNPVDIEKFPLISRSDARDRIGLRWDGEVVGFVGSPNQPRKGFGRLASALSQLFPRREDLILLVVGGSDSSVGADAARALSRTSPLRMGLGRPPAQGIAPSIASNTIVAGGVDPSMMADLYAAMDLLVHPSAADNLPTVPIEAGLVGTRPLATAVGGTEETVASRTDLIDPDIEPTTLARVIDGALDAAKYETGAAREARREILSSRFSIAAHRPLLNGALQWIAGGER